MENTFVGSIEILRNRDSFIHSIFYLIYLFNKHSLSTYYVLWFELATEKDMNKKFQNLTVKSGGGKTANELFLL